MSGPITEIRSFRSVFDLERRIYRVDRLRLNPGGIPVRGVVYFLALVATALAIGHIPVIGLMIRILPWYVGCVALPALTALLLAAMRIDGRPFHLTAHALVASWILRRSGRGRDLTPSDAVWWPLEIVFIPDGSDPAIRRFHYTGPGAVVVTAPHLLEGRATCESPVLLGRALRRPRVRLRRVSGETGRLRATAITLTRDTRMTVG
jgi:hypothetical protein